MPQTVETFLHLHEVDFDFFIEVTNSLTHEQIWKETPKGVSIANLLCHVIEMEKFWIEAGLIFKSYDRDRQKEFDRKGDLSPEEIVKLLEDRKDETQVTVSSLTHDNLMVSRSFHGDPHNGYSILLWHARHLGIHRGHVQAHQRWILSQS